MRGLHSRMTESERMSDGHHSTASSPVQREVLSITIGGVEADARLPLLSVIVLHPSGPAGMDMIASTADVAPGMFASARALIRQR